MRRILFAIISLAFCIAIISCSSNNSDKSGNEVEQNAKDSAKTNDLPAVDTAKIEEDVEDVVEDSVFVTPDLAFMEVRGHVKSVEYPNGRKAVFDEKGNMVTYKTEYSGENGVHIDRDDDGYIVSTYDGPGGSSSYDYDKEKIRLVMTAAADGAYYSECNIEYDDEGNIVRYNFVNEDYAEDTRDEWSLDIVVVSKDEYGNWTELKSDDSNVKRVILYY